MATFFQSFRSSSIPKRLLRYALSRLELLDSEALDIENLELELGRNTVAEFRDVGIRLQVRMQAPLLVRGQGCGQQDDRPADMTRIGKKLEKLLKLPSSFTLKRAKVLRLRVTIPVDFYTSPITVEVNGVEVRLKVASKEDDDDRTASRKTRPSADDDDGDVLPHAADLAQSFLETTPQSEKRELERALAAEAQDLGASIGPSEDSDDEDDEHLAYGAGAGVGQPLSLPAFLTDFLQGVVDRTQVRIRGVTFQLDVEVPVLGADAGDGGDREHEGRGATELVGFQLALESVDVEGVTMVAAVPAAGTEDEPGPASPTIVPKEGKRHISLNNIRAYLVSEANVFAAFTRGSPSVSSPVSSSQSSAFRERQVISREASSLASGSGSGGGYLAESRMFDSHDRGGSDMYQNRELLQDSEDAFDIPYDLDAQQEQEQAPEHNATSPLSTPRASVYQDPTPYTLGQPSQSTMLPEPGMSWTPTRREARSAPDLQEIPILQRADTDVSAAGKSTDSSAASLASSNGGVEDLTESKVFTHEEAESMYMSAFSSVDAAAAFSMNMDAAVQHGAGVASSTSMDASVQRGSPAMPGAWDSSPPRSAEGSPRQAREAPAGVPDTVVEETPSQLDVETTAPSTTPAAAALDRPDSPQPESEEPPVSPRAEEREPASKEEDDGGDAPETEDPVVEPVDDAPTPKGPTRIVKEVLSLRSVSIYVPSQHKHLHVSQSEAPSLARSTNPALPGAFSVYQTTQSLRSPQLAPKRDAESLPEAKADDSLEVHLEPLDVKIDASTGFVLAMVVSKLLDAAKESYKTEAPKAGASTTQSQTPQGTTTTPPPISIHADQIVVHFLEKLLGVPDTPDRIFGPFPVGFEGDVLLRLGLQNLSVNTSSNQGTTETTVTIDKFRFGYANDDILSFIPEFQMGASIRDAFPPSGADISVTLTQSPEVTRCNVLTLPLHVRIDLQRLDETFSWFGGLSSFLNMSSSMASGASPSLHAAPPSPTPARKPRGVRFDAPINAEDQSVASGNKVSLRVGGFRLDLVGKECSVSVDTTAVKMVSRDEGLGLSIRKMLLSGPHLMRSGGGPPISVDVDDLRLEYSASPTDKDLERLLQLIVPSRFKFDQDGDEILVDTLLKQRRKGPVLRANVRSVAVSASRPQQQLAYLPALAEELGRLGAVAKYLPEDDRPGLLTLALVETVTTDVDVGAPLGSFAAKLGHFELAHITIPSLVAFGINEVSLTRNKSEKLVGTAPGNALPWQGPVLMLRMIGDEIEPRIKLKMRNVEVEYRVPTVMDILGLAEDATPQDFEASLAASVADLGERAHHAIAGKPHEKGTTTTWKGKDVDTKPTTVDIILRDCLVGLNPLGLKAKLIVVLADARFEVVLPRDDNMSAAAHISKASLLLIDDVSVLETKDAPSPTRRRLSDANSQQVAELCARGYVIISYISSARATVQVTSNPDENEKYVEVEIRDDLLVLETCADSTQTLIALANALKPPTPPSKELKYRTRIMPVENLLASLSAEAFGSSEAQFDFDKDFAIAQELGGGGDDEYDEDEDEAGLAVDSQYFAEGHADDELLFDATAVSGVSDRTETQDTSDGVLLTNLSQAGSDEYGDGLDIQDNYFGTGSVIEGTAHRWNSAKGTYDRSNVSKAQRSPLRVRVRDVHVIWNLFDGYDWARTRDVIAKAVHEVEAKAYERRARRDDAAYDFEDEETEVGDFLFNSIYISIPTNQDPAGLAGAINHGINDNATETESVAPTTVTSTTMRAAGGSHRAARGAKKLKLNRSKRHKITFELKGVNVDLITFPPGSGETQSTVDVRVRDLDIFDHVPTSTWKKFATYDQDAGERELGASMVHLELINVKPVPDLAASEIVLKAKVLPLRLHVDQDALDFITRFFEFKDETVPIHASPSDVPFLQRAEVESIPVKLDFKPKRVDYAGLRSGHTTEFMNFLVLDEARMVLRHTIIHGVSGFDRLGKTLNDIWMPDIKRNQLPGILAGLAPVRSLVNVGSGFRDLVEIPIREYRRDGRIVRSLGKGVAAFGKTTGTEIVKLGAKLAVGTQYALQGAEGMLTNQGGGSGSTGAGGFGGGPGSGDGYDDDDADPDERRQISLYADQPTGVVQGLQGAYTSLRRDLNLARDAIIAVPGEVMESGTAQGAAKAVLRRAPTIIFRPAIGATKAIGQTLMGATNSLDPQNRRRVEEVSILNPQWPAALPC